MQVINRKGHEELFEKKKLRTFIQHAVKMNPELSTIDICKLTEQVNKGMGEKMKTMDIAPYIAETASSYSTHSYHYSLLAGRVEAMHLHANTLPSFTDSMMKLKHLLKPSFVEKVQEYNYDIHIDHKKDFQYDIIGIRTLKRSYLLRNSDGIIERPQYMLMRVALFLSDTPPQAIELYNILSDGWYTHATPTLYNAGLKQHQLASCFLMSMKEDSIDGIYDTLKDVALISKSAGGIGISVSNIRAKGTPIKGTNGTSNGLVPMLKCFNSTARYVDQCVVPNTIIYTTKGPCEIQHLVNGEAIIHEENDEPISNVLEHAYNGKLLHIKTMHSVESLKITPEHPIFVLKDMGKAYNFSCIKERLERGFIAPDWVEAKDVKSRDFIGFPIPKYEKDEPNISSEDCYFYGLLLGDGTLAQNKPYGKITLHTINKSHIKEWLIQYFDSKCIQYTIKIEDNTTRVRWNKSTLLPIKYGDVYDQTGEKHVHGKWLHLPLNKCKFILKGLIDTDGSKGKELQFDSTSRNLIESVRYMCLRMGVLTSGYVRDRRGQSHMTSRGIITNKKISFVLRIPKVKQICVLIGIAHGKFTKYFEHNNILYTRVKSIEKEIYEGTLYDLQMSKDHSYITHNGLVHNGGGKRKGSFAIYIEPWHKDIQDVLKLKLNHGDENERARDLFYGLWIPDLFMKRVEKDEMWTLFCPTDAPELQDAYGAKFDKLYHQYENNIMCNGTKIKARELWFQICTTQIETGTPYLLYKDACNKKSNQQNLGTIRSSNLCCEIIEYHSEKETAVCTLASIALPKFVTEHGFNFDKLIEVAGIVTENLNKVIDKSSYPTKEALNSNMRNRPIGIGVQGLNDCLQMLGHPFDSKEALELNRDIFETIYYGAVKKSIELAKQDGPYRSFEGSPTSKGLFQFDLWGIKPSGRFNWSLLSMDMMRNGIRNSLLTAPMPTASSAQILGNTESFEPRTSNMYVRRVLSGEYVIINKYLQMTCEKLGMWNSKLINNIMQNKGSVQDTNLPDEVKKVFKTSWEISQKDAINMAIARAPYIDQSQSLNLYLESPTVDQLTSMHFYAWKSGLKTGQYYLRTKPRASPVAFTVEMECESCSA